MASLDQCKEYLNVIKLKHHYQSYSDNALNIFAYGLPFCVIVYMSYC